MNRDIAIDSNGNFVKNGLDLRLTSGLAESVSQKLQIKLRTFAGEYFLDNSLGLPYLGIEKNPDQRFIESQVKKAILSIPEIASIVVFTSQFDVRLRKWRVDFAVKLRNGENLRMGEVI